MKTRAKKFVAPDGGWGWIACFGVSLVNLATRSMEPSFGLLFGDLLRDLDVGTTGASVIISTLDVCMNFSGLFVGPLLKEFSYRKVAVAGSLLCAMGLACTSPASSMPHILSTYGVINGIGVGLATSAAFVALNHYFKHKRGQAVGLSMAGTALGMLIMPQLVRLLLEAYGFRGAVLLLSGVSLNATVGAVLLQPAKWHMKEEISNEVDDDSNDENEMPIMVSSPSPEIVISTINDDSQQQPTIIINEEDALPEMKTFLFNKHMKPCKMRKNFSEMAMDTLSTRLDIPKRPAFPRITSLIAVQNAASAINGYSLNGTTSPTAMPVITGTAALSSLLHRKHSVTSNLSYMDFTGSILQVHLNVGDEEFERSDRELKRVNSSMGPISMNNTKEDSFLKMNASFDKGMELKDNYNDFIDDDHNKDLQMIKKKSPTFWKRFADLMDIDLLKDKMFLNILFGLSIFYVAEMNFKMVTPFFFDNLGYNKTDVAFCLSITAITDIAARIVLPPIFDRVNIKKRTIFLISIIFVAITRSIMAEQTEWGQLMLWLSICGFFRGSALSNFTLTVSEYCSLEKLPSAFGWHLVGKAVFVICFGPLIGLIRDITGSFPICIHVQSLCIALCAFAWIIEYLIGYVKERKIHKTAKNIHIIVDSDHNIK